MAKTDRLDDINRRILSQLRKNPRASTKSLAQDLEISITTVTARLRSMMERELVRPTVQSDLSWFGYEFLCLVDIWVSGRPLEDVVKELKLMPHVASIVILIGNPAIHLHVHVRNRRAMVSEVLEPLSHVEGVTRIATSLALESVKEQREYGIIESVDPLVYANPTDLDHRIITELQKDARTSFREVARRLDISEGVVRMRVKHLQASGIMRISVVANPEALGLTNLASIRLSVPPKRLREFARDLVAIKHIPQILITDGPFNLYLLFLASSKEEIYEFVSKRLADTVQVDDIDVQIAVACVKDRYDVVFLGS